MQFAWYDATPWFTKTRLFLRNKFKNLLLKCVLYFGDIGIEISENIREELGEAIKTTPKGKSVQLNMKRGRVFFHII